MKLSTLIFCPGYGRTHNDGVKVFEAAPRSSNVPRSHYYINQTNGMKEDASLEMVGAATNMTGTVGSLSALAKWAATEKLFL